MSLKTKDLDKIIEWLGADGAFSGLYDSKITNTDLLDLLRLSDASTSSKTSRFDIIVELTMKSEKRIQKSTDELFSMNREEIESYMKDRKASKSEVVSLLKTLDIQLSPRSKIKYREFAAREISDLGMFQRIAKGSRS